MRISALQILASLTLACIPMDRVATAGDPQSHVTTADKPAFMKCCCSYRPVGPWLQGVVKAAATNSVRVLELLSN
jgi:hypothetical protein